MTRAQELRFVVGVDDYEMVAYLFRDLFDLKVLQPSSGSPRFQLQQSGRSSPRARPDDPRRLRTLAERHQSGYSSRRWTHSPRPPSPSSRPLGARSM